MGTGLLEADTAFTALAARLMAARPELAALDAVVLTALLESLDDSASARRPPDTGRLARRFNLEHALVRRSASTLESRGWLVTASKSGRSPALILQARDPEMLRAVLNRCAQ